VNRAPLAVAVLLAAALASCAGPGRGAGEGGLPAGLDEAAARKVLARFAEALEARDFERAHGLLSSRWRALTTPARLARDFEGASALATEAAARARREAPSCPVRLAPGSARLVLGEGREAALVAEGGVWRVDALE
jgi:hypothetical protein